MRSAEENMHQIELGIRPSIVLSLVLGAMSLLGVVCLAVLPWPWRLLSWLMLLAAAGHAILQHGLRRLKHSVVTLQLKPDNSVSILLKDGRRQAVRIMPSTVVTPLLSVVHYRLQESAWYWPMRHVLILADAVDAEDYRRLRVHLRWSKLPI
jgi:toxin CptA